AGMFAVSVYMIFMGGYYDRLMITKLPAGSSLDTYRSAAAGTDMHRIFDEARSATGPEVLNSTLIITVILIVAFAGLNIYMKGRKKPDLLVAAAAGH
ncbi:MAG TPA: MFS transporter, partial [Puia sp.]|nr:MFS transporter [Puia sp.]